MLAATRLIPMRKNKGKSIGACLHNHTSYIQNPDKTEQGELVSSYQCSPLTVDEEFLLTKRLYEQTTGRSQKSDVIAYQVRQSFKPGEVTPEEANRIGYEFAERFLKGKHAFIVATHTDRAHIHNHIIYNSTALDGRKKFRNFWLSTFAVQRLSDLICLEHQLSTIEYKPYRERQKRIVYPPKESNRDRLCGIIDTILAEQPKDFEVFLQKLGLSLNYDSQQLTDYRVGCVGTAFRLYKQMGEPLYCETMRLIVAAWEGKPDSFRASVLKGMMHFVELYHGEFSEERLLRALRNIHPVDIYRIGQDDPAKLRGWKKYVFPIYTAYNGKCRKDALPMKF